MKAKLSDVFEAIISEREYQDRRWNSKTTISSGQHELESFVLYIEDYIREMKTILSRTAQQEAYEKSAHIMRKIAALTVAAMEQHGAPLREDSTIVTGMGMDK